jgi:hypothetical protein
MDPATLASRLFGTAVMASGRPVATGFAVQAIAAIAIHNKMASLPSEFGWIVSPLALVVGLVMTVTEFMMQHTEGADDLLRSIHADKILGAIAGVPAMAAVAFMTSVGADVREDAIARLAETGVAPEEAAQAVDEATLEIVKAVEGDRGVNTVEVDGGSADVVAAIKLLDSSQASTKEKSLLLGAAFLVQFAMVWVRGKIREFVDQLNLERVWAWLETGGFGAAVLLVVLAPALLLAFTLLLTIGSIIALIAFRFAAAIADAARRRPCPACSVSIRAEASRCPRCRAAIAPTRLLGEHPSSALPQSPSALALPTSTTTTDIVPA